MEFFSFWRRNCQKWFSRSRWLGRLKYPWSNTSFRMWCELFILLLCIGQSAIHRSRHHFFHHSQQRIHWQTVSRIQSVEQQPFDSSFQPGTLNDRHPIQRKFCVIFQTVNIPSSVSSISISSASVDCKEQFPLDSWHVWCVATFWLLHHLNRMVYWTISWRQLAIDDPWFAWDEVNDVVVSIQRFNQIVDVFICSNRWNVNEVQLSFNLLTFDFIVNRFALLPDGTVTESSRSSSSSVCLDSVWFAALPLHLPRSTPRLECALFLAVLFLEWLFSIYTNTNNRKKARKVHEKIRDFWIHNLKPHFSKGSEKCPSEILLWTPFKMATHRKYVSFNKKAKIGINCNYLYDDLARMFRWMF